MGALGLAPPHLRCRWEPLQPLLLWGIIKAETRGEAAGRGCSSEPSPPNGKNSNRTQSGKEGGSKWREDQALLKPQTPGWWCEYPSNTLSSQHPKFHSITVPIPESVLPGLCKMRRKTSGWRRASSLRGAGTGASHPDPPPGPAQNGYSWLSSRNSPKLRRAWRETLCLLGARRRARRGWKTDPGTWGLGVRLEMDEGSREQEHLQLLCFILCVFFSFFFLFLKM